MNIAPIGKLYRDGLIDGFQVRAILPWMSNTRFRNFDLRWRVCEGSQSEYVKLVR